MTFGARRAPGGDDSAVEGVGLCAARGEDLLELAEGAPAGSDR